MRRTYRRKTEDKELDYYSIYIYANSIENPKKRDAFCFDASGLYYSQLEEAARLRSKDIKSLCG